MSLATGEFGPDGTGTRMRFTEQVGFVDDKRGADALASRHQGTDARFGRLLTVP